MSQRDVSSCSFLYISMICYLFFSHKKVMIKILPNISTQILARFSPVLFSGSEEELINFLKDDNEIIKEGILHVLAKAGGIIREQLAVSSRYGWRSCSVRTLLLNIVLPIFLLFISSSIDLILERPCLEGTRRQAKYAVHALAAITKDDGLKSLSVLYKVCFNNFMNQLIIIFKRNVLMTSWWSLHNSQLLKKFVGACGYAWGEDSFACCTSVSGMYSSDSNACFRNQRERNWRVY